MTRIFGFLARSWVFGVSVAVLAVFMATILPAKAGDAASYTPVGASFDTSFFYTPAQAIERLGLYSPEGRAAYVYDRWTFDLAWPLVYGFFLLSGWAFGMSCLVPAEGKGRDRGSAFWLLVPALSIFFDFVENAAVTVLMLAYPAAPLGAAVAASVGTVIKWVFVVIGMSGAIGLPLAGGIAVMLRRRGSGRV
ncbi:MAG: hypothetical protein A3J97_11640 [Spirochaetes bacterium RIFOXYC1_FULL_54_7]|nr:MAG: hypothetical protein A3J97_11640 [Spirochaetes bacterium RIFOXYC1_FULL_54_7]